MGYLERYFLYLLSLGYSTSSNIAETNTTIGNYVEAINDIAVLEGKNSSETLISSYGNVFDLSNAMETLYKEYSDPANKGNRLPNNNARTLNGLKHFSEFLKVCIR